MINKTNEPIVLRKDGSYAITLNNLPYGVELNSELHTEVEAYLKDHPEALVDEPKPPEPTEAELKQSLLNDARIYLSSTDWYVTRFTETGKAIPQEVSAKRSKARMLL